MRGLFECIGLRCRHHSGLDAALKFDLCVHQCAAACAAHGRTPADEHGSNGDRRGLVTDRNDDGRIYRFHDADQRGRRAGGVYGERSHRRR